MNLRKPGAMRKGEDVLKKISNRPQHGFTPMNDPTREIIFAIRRLIQAKEFYTKELNKQYSVSSAQLNAILALDENGPLAPSQIARFILVKSSTVTGIIDRLEEKGLVERKRVSVDRRVITVALTPLGKRLAKNAPPPIQQKIIDGLKNLSEAEIRKIVTALNIITAMLDVQNLEVQ